MLFRSDLLGLKNGPVKLRALLENLPAHENWQASFFAAFRENFHRPLDVEKWWALRVVTFAARAPGPRWTPAISRDKLNAALVVPVNIRSASNALPTYAEMTFQAVIQKFAPDQQAEIFQTRLRDLELIQFRLGPSLASLAAGYRQVLEDYLGAQKKFFSRKHSAATAAVKQLDALDARRREVEAKLKLGPLPADLNLFQP